MDDIDADVFFNKMKGHKHWFYVISVENIGFIEEYSESYRNVSGSKEVFCCYNITSARQFCHIDAAESYFKKVISGKYILISNEEDIIEDDYIYFDRTKFLISDLKIKIKKVSFKLDDL